MLLPRKTLRELISAARAGDLRRRPVRADVRRASAGSAGWPSGSGRRRGPLTQAADRLPPFSLSLSLGDERVILAHRTPVRHPVRAAAATAATRGPRRPARLQGGAHDPGRRQGDAGRRRRPRAADRRRVAGRDARTSRSLTASTCSATRPTAATAPRRRRATCARCSTAPTVDRDGARRQPVRPGAGGRDGGADPGRGGRHRDRLAAARRPRDRGRDAALEVARQPAADRDREPRRSACASPSTTRATARSAPTSCARSRSCATPTTSSSTRRSSPRCSRGGRGWWRSRSRRATSTRRRRSTSVTSLRYAFKTLFVLARFRLDRRWALLRRPAACIAPPPQRLIARRAGDPDRLRSRDARLPAHPRRDRLRPARGVDRRRARVRAVLRAPDRVPAARVPDLRGRASTSWWGTPTRPRASRRRGSPTRSSGTGIVALIGLIAFQLWGRRVALVALALGAVYIPLILVGQSVMSEPLFVLCLLGAIAAVLHSRAYPWVIAGRRADGAGDPRAGERDRPAAAAGGRGAGGSGWRAPVVLVRGGGA